MIKKDFLNTYIRNHDWKSGEKFYNSLSEKEKNSKSMVIFLLLLKIAETEEIADVKGLFWRKDVFDIDSGEYLYYQVKYNLRRVEYDIGFQNVDDIIRLNLSCQMILMMISLFCINKRKVAKCLHAGFVKAGDIKTAQILKKFYSL